MNNVSVGIRPPEAIWEPLQGSLFTDFHTRSVPMGPRLVKFVLSARMLYLV